MKEREIFLCIPKNICGYVRVCTYSYGEPGLGYVLYQEIKGAGDREERKRKEVKEEREGNGKEGGEEERGENWWKRGRKVV